jgi:hypothetical protein
MGIGVMAQAKSLDSILETKELSMYYQDIPKNLVCI